MSKKVVYGLTAILVATGATAALLAWDMGPGITPLAKAFIVFFGAIVALQCIPAAILFGCMVKQLLLFGVSRKAMLTEEQSESGAST